MTRRTTNPMTRLEAQKILSEPIRDGRESRLAASYLDLLDAFAPIGRENHRTTADEYMAAALWMEFAAEGTEEDG